MTSTGPVSVLGMLAARPALWPTALRQLRRLARPGWWRRAPFAPLPPTEYRRFRSVTQYGEPTHRPEATDIISYLHWCRQWERLT